MNYPQIGDINQLQTNIMVVINDWSHKEKTPISRKYVISEVKKQKVGEPTIINALNSLMKKGYIRRAIGTSNKTFFVQLRGL